MRVQRVMVSPLGAMSMYAAFGGSPFGACGTAFATM